MALKLWGPREPQADEGGNVVRMVGFPMATDNESNTFIFSKFYTSKPPLSWLVQELALGCIRSGVAPAALHAPGAVNIAADRLPRGFVSPCCISALGLDFSMRVRPEWADPSWWAVGALIYA